MDDMRPSHRRSWTPIGETSHQLIVYHPPSHAIQVVPHPDRSRSDDLPTPGDRTPSEADAIPVDVMAHSSTGCPLCGRPWASDSASSPGQPAAVTPNQPGQGGYFRVLGMAHELSRPGTPTPTAYDAPYDSTPTSPLDAQSDYIEETDLPAKGYYQRFFREEGRLGIGAEGSVFLASHIISGNELGRYAVKKIAVGNSKQYLVRILREVRLLESLRHPNIIPYYHSWVDETKFSSFGPPVLALHVLMMYASAGNLDAFLLNRSHGAVSQSPLSARDVLDADTENIALLPKAERIKAFKRRRQSERSKPRSETRGIHLLGLNEITKLFGDVVEGLAFLHANSILHLDMKCSNVLLHWEEGKVIPKAMLSDFGTSEEMLRGRRERTGHTGTMEYMAPETLVVDASGNWRPSDSHADMWSLGIILHRMLFLQSPYRFADDLTALHGEIVHYPGFKASPEAFQACERRHIPRSLLVLLERLLHVVPDQRPSAEKVKLAVEDFARRATGKPWSRAWSSATQSSTVDKTKGRAVRLGSELSAYDRDVPHRSKPLRAERNPKHRAMSLPNLHVVIFILKTLSLQPSVVGVRLPLWLATCLSLISIWELLIQPPSVAVTASLLCLHVGCLWAKRVM